MFPVLMILKMVDEAEETASKSLEGWVEVAQRVRAEYAVEVPTEKRPRVFSQLMFAEPAKKPPLLNWTEPVDPPGVTTVEGTQTLLMAKQPAPRLTPPPKVEVAVPIVTMASPVKVRPLATMPPPKVEEEVVLVTAKVPTERPFVMVEVPDPATERRPEKVPPPVTWRPLDEERPAVWKPPATVEEAPVPVRLRKVD
jgi:hypothetical protein